MPPIIAEPKKINIQVAEINGKAKELHNEQYGQLLQKVVPIRKEFPKCKDVQARKQMAKEEFDAWNDYLEIRRQALPKPDFEIEQKDLSLLKEHFDRSKDRKTHAVKSLDMVEFHSEFAKKFKFRVPLHPKNLQQMIHPHFGYFANFKNRSFNFNELLQAYDNQIVSSYERSLGQDLLGDELACLSYWLIEDAQKKGYFSLKEVIPLLEAFRFDITPGYNLSNFKKEFRFLLQ